MSTQTSSSQDGLTLLNVEVEEKGNEGKRGKEGKEGGVDEWLKRGNGREYVKKLSNKLMLIY